MLLQHLGVEVLSSSNLSSTTTTLHHVMMARVGVGSGSSSSDSDTTTITARSPKLALWSAMLSLEVLNMVCLNSSLLLTIFRNYDLLDECTNVFATLVKTLSKFVIEGSANNAAVASLAGAAHAANWPKAGEW